MQQIALKNPEGRQKQIISVCSSHYAEWLEISWEMGRIKGLI